MLIDQPFKTEAEHDRDLRALGYYCAREHFPFGRCPWYRSDDDREGYYLNRRADGLYEVVDWADLRAILREDWRPVSAADCAWARANGCGG
jgi:hypothetical protein